MTLLPIAHRELLVSARKKAASRLRIFFALGAVAIAGAIGLLSLISKGAFGLQLGALIFSSLKWCAFIFACSAGIFVTSDCLSEEKREGTLGLLFLTHLRGYDVVLGKLAATSLLCFYSLLAIFPIMAFSFLLGGVAVDDFWRTMISVCNTLFFSLSLGMLVSVISRDTMRAMTAEAAAMLFFIFLTPQLDYFLLGKNANQPFLGLFSPLFGLTHTSDYHAREFWASALAVQILGWVFLGIASLLAPSAWREKGARQKDGQTGRFNWLRPLHAPAPKRELLETNPLTWIVLRDRWAPNLARLALVLALGMLMLSVWSAWRQPAVATMPSAPPGGSVTVSSSSTSTGTTVVYSNVSLSAGMSTSSLFRFVNGCATAFSLALEVWLVMHVVRFYVEGRRTGFFELLLVTPITMKDVLSGQQIALRKLFFAPFAAQLLLSLSVGLVPILSALSTPAILQVDHFLAGVISVATLALSKVAWIVGLFALVWMAVWIGLTSNKTSVAVLKTFCYGKILPWFGVYFVFVLTILFVFNMGFLNFLSSSGNSAVAALVAWLPQVLPGIITIAVNIFLIRLARRRVRAAISKVN